MIICGLSTKRIEELKRLAVKELRKKLSDDCSKELKDTYRATIRNLKSKHTSRVIAGIINVFDCQYWLEKEDGSMGDLCEMIDLYGLEIARAVYDVNKNFFSEVSN